ncbi:hypothetical protein J4Q44_G00093210 [Coregonus suidteri]|uniref:Uncharacterized protein n=1 Tax=Coregonus suidteri TaxID=861788 RepID=A0AAN8M208_9TELE
MRHEWEEVDFYLVCEELGRQGHFFQGGESSRKLNASEGSIEGKGRDRQSDRQTGAGDSHKEDITALIVGLWCGHEKDRA